MTLTYNHNLAMVVPHAPAPPTNAQRAAHICHQGGVRAFASFFAELLNRIEALENVNVEQARRIADLELA